jgi:hypothetical protein
MHKYSIRLIALALTLSSSGAAFAAQPATQSYVSTEHATEASSSTVTLPSGPGSTLLVIPCPACAPLSFRATSTTTYFLRKQKVTLGELKAAIGGHSVGVTVFSSVKTHELSRVIADIGAPVRAPNNRASAPAPVRR